MRNNDEIADLPMVKVISRSDDPDDYGMAFVTVCRLERVMVVMSYDPVSGWEHVSVSCQFRIPTWDEMNHVKRMCFYDNEVAFQLHPAEKDYVNIHENVLHIWRNRNEEPPLPPIWMV